jgi:hypothetical protein
MLRFHIPLIKPDVRFSRIRLSDRISRCRPRDVQATDMGMFLPQLYAEVLKEEGHPISGEDWRGVMSVFDTLVPAKH